MRIPAGLLLASLLLAPPAETQEPLAISRPDLFEKSLRASQQALEFYGAYDDPEELERVADIGYRLLAESRYRDFPFSFFLVDIPVPNAFALPGGHIFVTRGMLDLGLSDDMLACLLGHEIAHVSSSHGTRMQKRATLLNILGQALLLGVLVGVDDAEPNQNPYFNDRSRKGDLIQGSLATSMVVSELLLRNYSRDFEDEADREGQRMAAAAGFDPRGASQLWALMNSRVPQSKLYGYWRTHPFSDQRMRAAEVRAEELKIEEKSPAEDFRALTQKVLLAFEPTQDKEGELELHLERAALTAWPRGPRAERLRLERLHRRRDAELAKSELERDYGELVRAYRVEIEEVRELSPESTFPRTLEQEMSDLRAEAESLLPKAREVWAGEIYQIPFLETFLSNYPTAEEAPAMSLALGEAYNRLGRQTDAVEQFLRASEAGPDSEAAEKAVRGLRNLAPYLKELTALQRLSDQIDDDGLRKLAAERLAERTKTFEDIADGAAYVRLYPEGEHVARVRERIEQLAQNLYGEVILYQAVGDTVKSLERIQAIMTHAPYSNAAEQLRKKAVAES